MDAQQALADLTEISSQIRAAVVFDARGKVTGSTLPDAGHAEALARSASELLSAAEGLKADGAELTQLEVVVEEGSVFVVRDGTNRIAATTGSEPTVGLVFYDLKSALRNLAAKPAAAKKAPATKTAAAKKPAPAKTSVPKKPAAKKPAAKKPATRRKDAT